jgi:arginine deiminase
MDAIFRHHPLFSVETINPSETVHRTLLPQLTIEGGDVLVLSDHVLLVGTGSRTSTHGLIYN